MERTDKGRIYTDIVLEVFKLGGLLVIAGDELTKDLGLTSARWKVLGALHRSNVPMTVSQIALSMGQTRQGVQRLSDAMVDAGFLAYSENPQHKKAKLVALTAHGEEVYLAIQAKQIPWANANAANLDAEDLQTAICVLRKMSLKLTN